MALVLKDRVKETTTTTGTGTITLAGAPVGYQAFSVIGDGNTTYYCIAGWETTEFEVGIGTYTLSGTTLSRTTILSSSNAGLAVNFSAGTKDVFVTYPSAKSVNLDASDNATALGTPASGVVTNLTGTASININGTVGATTPAAGAFTTLSANSGATTNIATLTGPANGYVDVTDGTGVLRMQMLSNVPHIGSFTNHNVNFITNNTVRATLSSTGLAITGTLSTTGVATFPAGTVALPSITTSGDTNTGIYFPAADTVGITNGGTERGRFTTTGFAVTGTASATGSITSGTTSTAGSIVISDNQNNGSNVLNTITSIGINTLYSELAIKTRHNSTLSTPFYINSARDIGLGGNITASALTGAVLVISGSSATERMRIDSSGNVGIGTSSPTTKLAVTGTLSATGTTFELGSAAADDTRIKLYNTSSGTGGSNGLQIVQAALDTYIYNYEAGAMYLGVGAATQATISSTGLAVTGTLSATGAVTFAAGTAALPSITTSGDTNTGVYFPAADTVGITTGGAQRGAFSSTGLAVTGALSATGSVTGGTIANNALIANSTFATPAVLGLVTLQRGSVVKGYIGLSATEQGAALIDLNGNIRAEATSTGLAVTGTLSATGVATFPAGTVALPSITTTGDTNTGIYFPAADTIGFTEGGAEAMRINSSGIVLVGTASATGTNLLQVNSDALVNTLTVGRGPGNLQSNAVLGYQALNSGTATSSNVAIGYQALFTAATSGADRQVAIGYQALYSNNDTTGAVNVGIGFLAGKAATGKSSIFIGGYCSYLRTTGDNNTFVGSASGTNFSSVPTGASNTGIGQGSLGGITTGYSNVAVGQATGVSIGAGACNVFIGDSVGYLATGSSNVFIGGGNAAGGGSAGSSQTTGNYNTYIGTAAGKNVTTGGSNVILGAYTGTAAPISTTGSNSIVFSDGAANVRQYYDGTNNAWVWNTGASERMRIDSSGNVGIGTASPDASFKVTVSGNSGAVGPGIYFVDQASSPKNYALYTNGTKDFVLRSQTDAINIWTANSTGLAVTGTLSATGTAAFGVASNPTGAVIYARAGTDNNFEVLAAGLSATGSRIFSRTNAGVLAPLELQANPIRLLDSTGTLRAEVSSTGLAVTGTLSATGAVTFAAGTVALPSITTSGDTNTGVYFPAADTVGITTGGTQRGAFSSTGLAVTGALSATGNLTVGGQGYFKGAISGGAANTLALANNGTGQSQIWALGPDASTSGSLLVVVARSNVTGSTSVATFSSTGLAVTGTLSATGKITTGVTGAGFPGSTSGTATIVAPAVAGTPTLTLPTLTGTVGLTTRTVQVFTSGSGTYTTPTGCKAIWVRCVGGGGGGGGTSGAGGTGGNTTFSSLTANGGSYGSEPNAGPTNTGGGASGGDINVTGGAGSYGGYSISGAFSASGAGGASAFGGAGQPGSPTGVGSAGNSGGGGGGAGGENGDGAPQGGGAGGYCEKLITSPSATYSYGVGAAGSAGGGTAGGAGGSGLIIVMETY